MIYLGVEYGAKYVLENPLPVPVPAGKKNLVTDPIFNNATLANNWAANNFSAFTRAPNMVLPTGESGYALAFGVSALQTGYIQTKNLITVGAERVDYGFWVRGAKNQVITLESVSYKTAEGSPVGASTNVTITVPEGTWQWVSATRTMPAETVAARFRIKQTGAEPSGSGLFIWGGMVTTGRTSLLTEADYFPTPKQLRAKIAQFTGTENESSTEFYNSMTRVVFNDSTDPDYVGDLDPESSGLDAPEIREDSNDRVESDGAIFGDFFSGKRPVVLQGRIIATSKAQRNERVGKLRAASLAKTQDATLWWEDAAGGKVFVNLRRQQPLRVTKGFVKEFQLAMVSSDSRILSYVPFTGTAKGITNTSQSKLPGNAAAFHIEGTNNAGWVNPNNAKLEDAVYATSEDSTHTVGATDLFGTYNYGFTIPSTAVVLGVEVTAKGKSPSINWSMTVGGINKNVPGGAQAYNEALLGQDGGELYGGNGSYITNKVERVPVTTVNANYSAGGSTERWHYTNNLTYSKINATGFGAFVQLQHTLSVGASKAELDAVKITVYYAEPLKVTAVNEGDAPSPAVIKVLGPLENFYVLNQTTGEILTYTGKVEAGKEIWFDTENVTVTEHGTGIVEPWPNRFANVGLPNDWIRILPGTNIILVAGLGGTASTEISIEYRNAWE